MHLPGAASLGSNNQALPTARSPPILKQKKAGKKTYHREERIRGLHIPNCIYFLTSSEAPASACKVGHFWREREGLVLPRSQSKVEALIQKSGTNCVNQSRGGKGKSITCIQRL